MDERIRKLETRLTVGYERIEQTPRGPERDRLNEFWLGLLHEYEELVSRARYGESRRVVAPVTATVGYRRRTG